MKKIAVSISLSCLLFAACKKDNTLDSNNNIYLQPHDQNEMMSVMHAMMSKMDAMSKTADPDIDFAQMMKMHHQGAIDMANLELQKGSNATMNAKAQEIIDEQQKEIQDLSNILAMIYVDNTDTVFAKEQKENMMKMGKAADIQLISGDIDNDFATLMITHHQSAIDNASAYLHHGTVAELKTMANNMVNSQTVEIQEMADWLKTNKR